LDFVADKWIVGIAPSEDDTDFDLMFEDRTRVELYPLTKTNEEARREPFITLLLSERRARRA